MALTPLRLPSVRIFASPALVLAHLKKIVRSLFLEAFGEHSI